jgi:transposase-like protein
MERRKFSREFKIEAAAKCSREYPAPEIRSRTAANDL